MYKWVGMIAVVSNYLKGYVKKAGIMMIFMVKCVMAKPKVKIALGAEM